MTNAGDALAPGTRLHELEIERVLGSGGFGITYLARDLSLETWRAVKEYLPREWGTRRQDGTVGPWTGGNAEDYQWGLERFLEEARILARFKHPHIVQVHRVFEALGTAYMVMEYVEGRTLASQVEAAGALSEDRVREVLDALTEGLKEVHAAELLHRDIKPANVVVRRDGSPVLIDFGAARHAMGGQSGTLASVLTPGYAPIEQYPPGDRQGPWTDIYALGALAYCALSGGVPKAATERTQEDRLRPLVEVAPQKVSSGLATAVGAAMAVYQEDRPQDLEAWQRLLDAPPGPILGKPLEPGGSSRGETSASPWQWWLAGAAAVGIVGVVLAMTLSSRNGAVLEERGGRVETASAGETALPSGGGEPVAVDADRIDDGEGGGSVREPDPESDREAAVVERPPTREALSPAAEEEEEEALGLDRNERRLLQAALVAAGFDVGPLDGMFGPGTRAVLREWQAAQSVTATGYLTGESEAALRRDLGRNVTPIVPNVAPSDPPNSGTVGGDAPATVLRSFEGTAGQSVLLGGGGENVAIQVMSPVGEVIAQDRVLETRQTLPASGQYLFSVRALSSDSSEFGLVVFQERSMSSLTLGTPSRGRWNPGEPLHVWFFEGVAGQAITVEGGGLLSPDYSALPSELVLPVSGRYFVIAGDNLSVGGSYEVVVRTTDRTTDRTTNRTTERGSLALNVPSRGGPGTDGWTFEGSAGQTISVSVVGGDSLFPRLHLHSPTERYLAYGFPILPIVETLPLSGRYVVDIDWDERPRGDYTIVVRAARPLAFDTPVRGIDGPGVEVWTFEGTAGQRVFVEFSDDIAMTYELKSPEGRSINQSFGGALFERLPVSGRYLIEARDLDGDPDIVGEGSGGTYTITVSTRN